MTRPLDAALERLPFMAYEADMVAFCPAIFDAIEADTSLSPRDIARALDMVHYHLTNGFTRLSADFIPRLDAIIVRIWDVNDPEFVDSIAPNITFYETPKSLELLRAAAQSPDERVRAVVIEALDLDS